MKLMHSLLFLIRENKYHEDLELAVRCLKSLEKSSYNSVIVYNQGFFSNADLKDFLSPFALDCIIIGDGSNVGTVVGRQNCFQYIFENYSDTQFISEIHLDMIFPPRWEDALVNYLKENDEPLICSGIIDQQSRLNFLESENIVLPKKYDEYEYFLAGLKMDKIVHGFTNPCIHKVAVLKETGGYNASFLRGKQCFEDDSMLLGYYYYYGTRANWHPKVNYNTVVYHAIAGQRLELQDNVMLNYEGLINQYGATGLKHLSQLHRSQWHKSFFSQQYGKYLHE